MRPGSAPPRYAGSEVEEAARELDGEVELELTKLEAELDVVEAKRLAAIHGVLEARGMEQLAGRVRASLRERFGVEDPRSLMGGATPSPAPGPAAWYWRELDGPHRHRRRHRLAHDQVPARPLQGQHLPRHRLRARAPSGGGVAEAWAKSELGFKPTDARIGLTGRDVNIRYTRVPRVPDWQLRKLMRFEVDEIGGQSGTEVASDFNVLPPLPEIEGEDVVLLAMARESLLEQHAEGLAGAGG